MSKLPVNPVLALHPFKRVLGTLFPKICNDAKSFLGRLEDNNGGNDVKSKLGETRCTAKCVLTNNEGHKLQMPPNNPMSLLIRDGLTLSRLDREMGTRTEKDGVVTSHGIDALIPSYCLDWIVQQTNAQLQSVPAGK
jgi:hypothetical protein